MSIGAIAISTTQKKEPAAASGFPFTAGSAYNGTSIDSTGRVVLGNDLAEPGAPAQLLNTRQILTNNNSLVLADNLANGETQMSGAIINMQATAPGVQLVLQMLAGLADTFQITTTDTSDVVTINTGAFAALASALIQCSTGNWQFGGAGVPFNGAIVQVKGSLSSDMLYQSTPGDYVVDPDIDRGKALSNGGAVGPINITLPSMAFVATGGFHIYIMVAAAQAVSVLPAGGQTIRIAGVSTTDPGGSATSATVGNCLHLVWDSLTSQWIAVSVVGAWVVI